MLWLYTQSKKSPPQCSAIHTNTCYSFTSYFTRLTFSSHAYFTFLLDLPTNNRLESIFIPTTQPDPNSWIDELLSGYVTSADTGNEDLVIASRAALTSHCTASAANLDRICGALLRNLKARQGHDRVVVPTLEITAFLFAVGVFPRAATVDLKSLCLQTQKAGYKSGNVRKLEACARVYSGIAALGETARSGSGALPLPEMASEALEQRRREGVVEARKRLGALLSHPWPRVRSAVVDELWGQAEASGPEHRADMLKGVDWGAAGKGEIKTLAAELGLS